VNGLCGKPRRRSLGRAAVLRRTPGGEAGRISFFRLTVIAAAGAVNGPQVLVRPDFSPGPAARAGRAGPVVAACPPFLRARLLPVMPVGAVFAASSRSAESAAISAETR